MMLLVEHPPELGAAADLGRWPRPPETWPLLRCRSSCLAFRLNILAQPGFAGKSSLGTRL